jgi:hypothetical protein
MTRQEQANKTDHRNLNQKAQKKTTSSNTGSIAALKCGQRSSAFKHQNIAVFWINLDSAVRVSRQLQNLYPGSLDCCVSDGRLLSVNSVDSDCDMSESAR